MARSATGRYPAHLIARLAVGIVAVLAVYRLPECQAVRGIGFPVQESFEGSVEYRHNNFRLGCAVKIVKETLSVKFL